MKLQLTEFATVHFICYPYISPVILTFHLLSSHFTCYPHISPVFLTFFIPFNFAQMIVSDEKTLFQGPTTHFSDLVHPQRFTLYCFSVPFSSVSVFIWPLYILHQNHHHISLNESFFMKNLILCH